MPKAYISPKGFFGGFFLGGLINFFLFWGQGGGVLILGLYLKGILHLKMLHQKECGYKVEKLNFLLYVQYSD